MVVHQLRYLLGYEGEAARALTVQGHAYLSLLTPTVGGALALALAEFGWRLTRPRRGDAFDAPRGFGRCWAFASTALVALYALQEWLEGTFEAGHPAGIAGVVGHGGWVALPLALAVGAVVALLLRGAATVIAAAARQVRALPRGVEAPPLPRPRTFSALRLAPLALCCAGRAPPTASGR